MERKDKSRFVIWVLIVIIILLITLVGILLIQSNDRNGTDGTDVLDSENITNDIVNEENNVTNSSVYAELTAATLGEKDVLFVTNATKNNDNTYTLLGVIYKHDENNYNEAQISDRWILTDEYRTITISKDLPCSMKYDLENKYNTVENIFSNYENTSAINTANPHYKNSFTFSFEGDKCVRVDNVLTGL